MRKPNLYFDLTIDLHGYRVDEALQLLEEKLFVESSHSILIIHGRGSGVLKTAVREFLKNCDYIKSYTPGEDINLPGIDGVTVVYT